MIVILLMCYGNLRGIREAGRAFALPTYLFTGSIVPDDRRRAGQRGEGNLPAGVHALSGTARSARAPGADQPRDLDYLHAGALFANGGSSLTGIEAVSNAVSAFKPPEGINARKVLVAEGIILAILVAGISWLAHVTHAIPYGSGYPTVISQEANLVFGPAIGPLHVLRGAGETALILYTGGNTSFNGFPFLTSFVAEDSFLPRWMTKRGHRLVFSNGIIVLTVVSRWPC